MTKFVEMRHILDEITTIDDSIVFTFLFNFIYTRESVKSEISERHVFAAIMFDVQLLCVFSKLMINPSTYLWWF